MISVPHPHQNVYLPSQGEIRERCLEIQTSWSPAEKERRRGLSRRRPVSPRILTCHLDREELEYAN